MTTVTLDNRDLVESVTTGKPIERPEITADNAAQAAKREAAAKGEVKEPSKGKSGQQDTVIVRELPKVEAKPEAEAKSQDDDVEGEDGLTPRQKREWTEAMRRTIAKKHRQQKEAEESAAAEYNRGKLAEERAAKLEAELARIREESKPKEVQESKAPERANFASDQEYQDALIDYKVDQKLKKQEAEARQRAEDAAQAEMQSHAKARIERAIELVPDFKEVTESIDREVPPHVATYMQSSELFAELGYHFAKHPEALDKLAEFTEGLTPGTPRYWTGVTKSLVEVGKIESKLSPFAPKAKADPEPEKASTDGDKPSPETGSSPSKPRVTAPIIRPLSTGSAPQVEKSPEDMSVADHLKVVQRKAGTALLARKRH